MAERDEKSPGTEILSSLAVAALVALATTCWQHVGEQAGLVCAVVLAPSAFALVRRIAKEHPGFVHYVTSVKLLVMAVLLWYLSLFPLLRSLTSNAVLDLSRPVPMVWVLVAGIGGFVLGAALLGERSHRGVIGIARRMLADTARTSASLLHRLATVLDKPADPNVLVRMLDSTERGSQVQR